MTYDLFYENYLNYNRDVRIAVGQEIDIDTNTKPVPPVPPTPAGNEIWYTTSDGQPYDMQEVINWWGIEDYKGPNIVSNELSGDHYIITFDDTVTALGRDYIGSFFPSFNSIYDKKAGINIDCNVVDIILPNTITSIYERAFEECQNLSSITIPESVINCSSRAFLYCDSLPVEDCVRYADTYLVEAVDKTLSTYTIKDGTKWIGNSAFEECANLSSITIPESVISIGDYVFSDCDSLPVEDGVRYADTYLIGAIYKTQSTYTIKQGTKWLGYAAFENCTSLTDITIPDSVISIGNAALYGCNKLTSITIPNSVINIGYSAFDACTKLTNIVIPDSVTDIGNNAFGWDLALQNITIGSGVTSIGEYAFRNCENLSSVTIHAVIPPTIYGDGDLFHASNECPIYVPAVSIDAYKTADGWSTYADRIQAIYVEAEVPIIDPGSSVGPGKDPGMN